MDTSSVGSINPENPMDCDNPELPSQNGLQSPQPLPVSQDPVVVESKGDAERKETSPESHPMNANDSEPARGLELIYQVASELATRIADEKRYAGIIIPCSVKLPKIPDASRYRVVSDPESISHESQKTVNITEEVTCENLGVNQPMGDRSAKGESEEKESSDEEVEMTELPANPEGGDQPNMPITGSSNESDYVYFCIFCRKKDLKGLSVAWDHYQDHLDYFPFKCAMCLEVTTSKENMIRHYRQDHSYLSTAKFRQKIIPWIPVWIETFLKSQIALPTKFRQLKHIAYCPVCDMVANKAEIVYLPVHLLQVRKHIIHIYKHLMYEPYECVPCKKTGSQFTVNDYDDRAYEHILRRHPECEDHLLTDLFVRNFSIKRLEDFVSHYLNANSIQLNRSRIIDKIPIFVRNKFKAKQDQKVKERQAPINKESSSMDISSGQQSSTSKPPNLISIGQSSVRSDSSSSIGSQITPSPRLSSISAARETIVVEARQTPPVRLLQPRSTPVTNFTLSNVQITPVMQTPVTSHSPNGPVQTQAIIVSPGVIRLPNGQWLFSNPAPIEVQQAIQANRLPPPRPQASAASSLRSLMDIRGPSSILLANQSPIRLPSQPKIQPPTPIPTPAVQLQPPSQQPTPPIQTQPVSIQVSPDIQSYGYDPSTRTEEIRTVEFVKREYICIFCKSKIFFEKFIDFLFHYAKHMKYCPVRCLLCSHQFQDFKSLMDHFLVDHPHEKLCSNDDVCSPLLYYIDHNGQTERWIENYYNFQISESIFKATRAELSNYCPICQTILDLRSSPRTASSSVSPSVVVVREHIHVHLNYTPYECFLCQRAGKSFQCISVGDTALRHIMSHGFTPYDRSFLREFFLYKPISGLETFIRNYIITEFYPYANIVGYGKGKSPPTQPSPTQSKLPKSTISSTLIQPESHPVTHGQPRSPTSVNVPKRLFSQPQESSANLYNESFRLRSGTVLACYHCKKSFPGPKEVLAHCKTVHPQLSIASYFIPSNILSTD